MRLVPPIQESTSVALVRASTNVQRSSCQRGWRGPRASRLHGAVCGVRRASVRICAASSGHRGQSGARATAPVHLRPLQRDAEHELLVITRLRLADEGVPGDGIVLSPHCRIQRHRSRCSALGEGVERGGEAMGGGVESEVGFGPDGNFSGDGVGLVRASVAGLTWQTCSGRAISAPYMSYIRGVPVSPDL